ncbi:type I restriction enzyme HsdR N-terminal domain-containing protein [Komagataeibacter rhaeticus]|nr:type I restriction enzyme HsdR N-terminal domain-containing protein [Komagataeibacter rhaeticus]
MGGAGGFVPTLIVGAGRMQGKTAESQTESDLESGITAAIAIAFPRLNSSDIKHQIEFTIQLGHAKITANGRKSWIQRGRADILLTHLGKPLAILELKKPTVPLHAEDDDQGISYARLLPTMAPFVVVTNGKSTRIIETFSGEIWTPETPDARAFEALVTAATKVAEADRHAAIATLMGSDPQVWTSAVITASRVRSPN